MDWSWWSLVALLLGRSQGHSRSDLVIVVDLALIM